MAPAHRNGMAPPRVGSLAKAGIDTGERLTILRRILKNFREDCHMRVIKSGIWPREKLQLVAMFVLGLVLGAASFSLNAQESLQFRNDVITQVPLGHIEAGKYAFRATITTIPPGGKIPYHVHEFGGLRYMLEGALTIAWKEGNTQTFSQGSTYYEGPGENHPPGVMAASNPTDKTSRVLIVELVPVN
jgi:quercetin dioxygenase-like cupin family protein